VRHAARALTHLLDRDRDRPARWFHPGFATEVARERQRLHHVVRARDLAVPSDLRGSFATLAQLLARDAAMVAVAVRYIEIDRSAALPAWDSLVRRGIPATPTAIETAIWFG
jgi:hypothetical protein